MKKVNDPVNLSSDLFAIELLYNDLNANINNTQLYNGNISAMIWTNWRDNGLYGIESYKYDYDDLSRLTQAEYTNSVSEIGRAHV